MAGNGHEKSERAAAAEGASEPDWESRQRQCMPCRGTGSLVSNLGGEERAVDCPWCEGSGERRQGIDAQARWLEQREAQPPAEPEPGS